MITICRSISGLVLAMLLANCDDATEVSQPPDQRVATGASLTSPAERERVKNFWDLYRRATAKRIAGDLVEATALLDSALVLDAEHLDALYYAGNVAYELGQFTVAEHRWRQELAANEHSARAHAQIGMLYSSGHLGAPFDLDVSRQQLQAAHKLNRAETGPLVQLGTVALLEGDRQGAGRWLQAAANTNARSVAAVYLLGYLAWSRGESTQMQTLFDQALLLASGTTAEVSASAEGQTASGRPLLERGRTPELAGFWRRLSPLAGGADEEYARFDVVLEELRRRLVTDDAANMAATIDTNVLSR